MVFSPERANEAARRDLFFFFKYALFNTDNLDPAYGAAVKRGENVEAPVKPFPIYKPHVRWVIQKLHDGRNNVTWDYKCRALSTTLAFIAYDVKRALFEPAIEIAIHRKTENDVIKLIAMVTEMLRRIPPEWAVGLPKTFECLEQQVRLYDHSGHPAGNIYGLTKNPSALQGWNVNTYDWDEFELDDNPQVYLDASVGSGRRLQQTIGVSNANGHSYMYDYIFGKAEPPRYERGQLVAHPSNGWMTEEIRGCWCGRNDRGEQVLFTHFTADPDKRPESEYRPYINEVTGESQNWYEAVYLLTEPSMAARMYDVSFEAPGAIAVFRQFRPEFHVVGSLAFDPRELLHIGMDLGEVNPAAVIYQHNSWGQTRVLAELMPPFLSFRDFLMQLGMLLATEFSGAIVVVHPDPTGKNKTGSDYFSVLQDEFGYDIEPPAMTTPEFRVGIISRELQLVNNGEPKFVIDARRCSRLIEAFRGGYRHQVRTGGVVLESPLKDGKYEHIVDGLGYGIIVSLLGRPVVGSDDTYYGKSKIPAHKERLIREYLLGEPPDRIKYAG